MRIVVEVYKNFMDNSPPPAGVAELVDAPDSKSGASNGVRVQVPPPAPDNNACFQAGIFFVQSLTEPGLESGMFSLFRMNCVFIDA